MIIECGSRVEAMSIPSPLRDKKNVINENIGVVNSFKTLTIIIIICSTLSFNENIIKVNFITLNINSS